MRFFLRVVAVIVGVVTFHILGIEFLLFFVMAPSLKEFGIMLVTPLPLAALLVGAYIVITYRYVQPVLVFLKTVSQKDTPDRSLIDAAQAKCINLPYFLSALSFPAYIIGGVGGVWLASRALGGWPAYIMVYGALAGVIAGLLTIPMAEYFAAIAIRPTLKVIMKFSPDFESARAAGVWIPLRLKFVLIVVVMVVGVNGYATIISYSMINASVDNMTKMEEMIAPTAAASLTDVSSGTGDVRVKSSLYFRSRLGSMKLFFIGVMVVGLLLAVSVSFAAANTITRPLHIFGRVAERIKDGQYSETIHIITNDEFAELGASFNRMTATLLSQLQQNEELIVSIREAVVTLGPMARELVSIADQQASASVEQAAATEHAADTGREISEAARQIAAHATRIARGGRHNPAIDPGRATAS